jgi:uncharacterized membrane protein
LVLLLLIGVWVGLPWLAPLFMALGWSDAGNFIYLVYATQCHQLPQRSFFLFGPRSMFSLQDIQAAWQDTNNPLILRQFIGNPEMGWKVAWSDRMVSMYSSTILWAALLRPIQRRVPTLPWWGLFLFLLPMAVDGSTHLLSDLVGGIGSGFRDSNAWLASLTGNAFPSTFYAGDALGSFNSWMRLITGLLFALGVVWFAFPRLGLEFSLVARQIEAKFEKTGLPL